VEDEVDHPSDGPVQDDLEKPLPSQVHQPQQRFADSGLEPVADPGPGDRVDPHADARVESNGEARQRVETGRLLPEQDPRELGRAQVRGLCEGSLRDPRILDQPTEISRDDAPELELETVCLVLRS
jgi:hypothetical protein